MARASLQQAVECVESDKEGSRCCGGKAPLVASLTALALIVVVAFVGLLVVLDRLQLDAADHARTATIRGALGFTASAVGAGFEEARVLALRLARDRKYGNTPSCSNGTVPLRETLMPARIMKNASTLSIAVYDIFLAPGVPQTASQLTYSICGMGDDVYVYHSNPPRTAQYKLLPLPDVVGEYQGLWTQWNLTDFRFARRIRALRKNTGVEMTGEWSESDTWHRPVVDQWIWYVTIIVPVRFDGPTDEPSHSTNIDIIHYDLEDLLRRVPLEQTHVALVDPRPSAIEPNVVPRNGWLLASTFPDVPPMKGLNTGNATLWPADSTPNAVLNAAVNLVVALAPSHNLNLLNEVVDVPDGPDDNVVGAISIVLPARLRLTVFIVTKRNVFYGNLDRSRRLSWSVGAACGLICLVALIAFVLISNNAARRLLQHVMSNSGRDIRLAPKDESKPFAIAFTDIQSSTALWARLPQEMGPALDTHHAVIRRCIGRHSGYEVKTIGDSFMVAFEDPASAVAFSLDVQTELHSAHWGADDEVAIDNFSVLYEELNSSPLAFMPPSPSSALDSPAAPECFQFVDPQLWAGLRVRVGVHYGCGEIKLDETTKGYDYYGTVVNTAARVESTAHGGQVLVTQDVLDAISNESHRRSSYTSQSILNDVDTLPIGPCTLRGLSDPVELVQLLPARFKGRMFPPPRTDLVYDSQSDTHFTSTDGADGQRGVGDQSPSICLSAGEDLDAVLTQNGEKAVFETVWQRHHSVMSLETYSLCCETVKAVMASLPDEQRSLSLRLMAKKWHVPHVTQSGTALSDVVLIAYIVKRAAPVLQHNRREQDAPAAARVPNSRTPLDGNTGVHVSVRSGPGDEDEGLTNLPQSLSPLPPSDGTQPGFTAERSGAGFNERGAHHCVPLPSSPDPASTSLNTGARKSTGHCPTSPTSSHGIVAPNDGPGSHHELPILEQSCSKPFAALQQQ